MTTDRYEPGMIDVGKVGQPVMYNGKKVGTVTGLEVKDGAIIVKMDLEDGFRASWLTGIYSVAIPAGEEE